MADRNFEVIKLLGTLAAPEESTPADAGEADETDDGQDVQVVKVSRVEHAGVTYLVEKATGVVYTNDLDDPQAVGHWTEHGGVVLESDPAGR